MKKILGALAATLIMTSAAQAAWPDKIVTMVVPFPQGGSTDLIGRLLSSRLEAQLGQTFVIDNKDGANGTIGAAHVARAKPDGHPLLRLAEPRGGKACVSPCCSRWSSHP